MKIESDCYYSPSANEMRTIGAVQTLARWRHEGKGPAYIKSGSRVLYLGADVLAWLAARRVENDEVA
ncbi:helix-turn-helix domain-containing protein [Limibaculum sp. FT325]|uniref:helix-turn-helix transcriptional regulator n=1 Tax=Thermohalobaculum sediminis TaxID=2939436 RepID=UPI0020BE4A03|nr:helix-turn-helix domain-containing protein [Limibaculum sediminis]MCL5776438.1 helix-turn-helix domain-containing protein [Limibaculum sediminis]